MKARRRGKGKPKLMLTSLLDMFTIILLFLLVNFDSENTEFKKNDDAQLPASSARGVFKPAANVAVTMNGVVLYPVDRETRQVKPTQIVEFKNGYVQPQDLSEEGNIEQLKDALEAVLDARQSNSQNPDEESIVMVQADKRLEYQTIFTVLRSARAAGFDKTRLVVMKQ
jgi:biopolymer transport protein ExbD